MKFFIRAIMPDDSRRYIVFKDAGVSMSPKRKDATMFKNASDANARMVVLMDLWPDIVFVVKSEEKIDPKAVAELRDKTNRYTALFDAMHETVLELETLTKSARAVYSSPGSPEWSNHAPDKAEAMGKVAAYEIATKLILEELNRVGTLPWMGEEE